MFRPPGSGSIEFNEFLTVMAQLVQDEDSEEDLVMIFRILDQDGDGFISKSDLREVVIRYRGQNTGCHRYQGQKVYYHRYQGNLN